MSVNDRLVWIDCEMTGLDIERDALIEIACLVTGAHASTVIVGAAPPGRWNQAMHVIARAISGVRT